MNTNNNYNCKESIPETMYVDEATILGSSYAPFLTFCGENSRAFFKRVYEKACLFSQQPILINSVSGKSGWNTDDIIFKIPKNVDYLNGLYFKFKLSPIIDFIDVERYFQTMNCGHQIIRECRIKFNDMTVDKLNNHILNLTQSFTVPNSQKNNYYSMISGHNVGDFSQVDQNSPSFINSPYLSQITNNGKNSQFGKELVRYDREIIQPIPFWFYQQQNSEAALPVAAVPYNNITIELDTNEENKVFSGLDSFKHLTNIEIELWANCITVSNEERSSMACSDRDVLIRQHDHQRIYTTSEKCASNTVISRKLNFKGAVESLYFGCHGNYKYIDDGNYNLDNGLVATIQDESIYCDVSGTSLVRYANIKYENNESRTGTNSYQYYQNVQPFFHAKNSGYSGIRDEGKLMYSFALDVNSFDHTGYLDFSKLGITTLELWLASKTGLSNSSNTNLTTCTEDSFFAAEIIPEPSYATVEVVATLLNVGRFSSGAFGFPIM